MNANEYRPKKLFSVEEANATLPLVRAITSDLAALAADVTSRRQRLEHLMAGRDVETRDPYNDEVTQMAEDLQRDAERLQEYVDELQALGVEPKGATEGLVDFPSMMDGQIVFLCWRLGEPEVLHWHELEAGFAGRQSLTAGSVADGGNESEESL